MYYIIYLPYRQCNGYDETTLQVTSGNDSREVTHYHYTSWPDFGTPRTPVEFIELVRSVGDTKEGVPILVHCSAGLGRSGVFVAVHSSLEAQVSEHHRVDLATTVREMRKQRGGMIQTADQYRFCFEAIAEALDPILPHEEVPQGETHVQSPKRSTTSAKTEVRHPSSPPQLGESAPHTERKRRYLQDSIPPPPSYPPTEEKQTLIENRVSSPPPPYSSPSPPLTPSTSVETTPTKALFVTTSPEDTPTKHSVSTPPDIIVTPPTRRPSQSSIKHELGSIERKRVPRESKSLKEAEEGSGEETRRLVTSVPTPATQPSTEQDITKAKVTGSLKREKEDRLKHPPPMIKAKPSKRRNDEKEEERETIVSEQELRGTLERFEDPHLRQSDAEPQIEEGGFEISDDQVLEAGPSPTMEVVEDTPAPVKWGAGLAKKLPSSQVPLPTARTKPRKWEPVSLSHSHVPVSSIVNRGENERTEDGPQKAGKLVIPSVFGASTAKPTIPPPSPKKKPVYPPPQPVKPVSEVGQPKTTPPVMRMIRKIEAAKQETKTSQPTNRATEPVKPVAQEQPTPVKQPEKPVEQDSPPARSVKALLARFESK